MDLLDTLQKWLLFTMVHCQSLLRTLPHYITLLEMSHGQDPYMSLWAVHLSQHESDYNTHAKQQ